MVIVIVLSWLFAGLAVFFVAIRGGPRGARQALHTESKLSRRLGDDRRDRAVRVRLGRAGDRASPHGDHKASVGVGGVHLNAGEQKGRELFAKFLRRLPTLAATKSVGEIARTSTSASAPTFRLRPAKQPPAASARPRARPRKIASRRYTRQGGRNVGADADVEVGPISPTDFVAASVWQKAQDFANSSRPSAARVQVHAADANARLVVSVEASTIAGTARPNANSTITPVVTERRLSFDSVCSAWRAPRGPPRIATKNTARPSNSQLRTMTMTMRARTYRLATPNGRSEARASLWRRFRMA